VGGGKVFRLGFDETHGDRLGVDVDLYPEHVVNAAFCLFSGLALDDLDGPGCLFPPDEVFCPATGVKGRIN
jgi:hypothetical protein